MGSRLCGYCRMGGHRVPDCPMKAEQRKTVLTHTPKERKYLLEYMAKQGFGNGAVLRTGGHYTEEGTAILNGGSWIAGAQFCAQNRVKYSKQVALNLNESVHRINGIPTKNQYGHISANAFVTSARKSCEQSLHISMHDIANPKMMEIDNNRGYSVALLEPSYEPYDVSPEELASHIFVHKRLFIPGEVIYDRWSDYTYVQGFPPT